MSDEDTVTKQETTETGSQVWAPPPLYPGDPVPWFEAPADNRPDFRFSSLGGRYLLFAFLRSFSHGETAQTYQDFIAGAQRFVAVNTAMILVTGDARDAGAAPPPGVTGARFFYDFDGKIARLFGVADDPAETPTTFLIDERLRVTALVRTRDAAAHAAQAFALFDRLPPLPAARPAERQAPVLIIPNVFERAFCKRLIAGYEQNGGTDSGYMIERDGMTVPVIDYQHKRRADWMMEDLDLIRGCHTRIRRRIVPEIARAFQFDASRIERNTIACYRADEGGHFARHRDNTTKGTAHRRFAVSVNLNTEEFEGGDLVFSEFGGARYRPPTGGACVFSCSLMHEATPVTKGVRYVYVPFLYDDAAAAVRERNRQFLSG